MIDLTKLATEQRNPATMDLDTFTPLQIAEAMNHEDQRAVEAVHAVLPQVATAISWATEALARGGRIVYLGAGTSGRLGVLDAVECPPTFGVSYDTVIGLIAGGEHAFVQAKEGEEDRAEGGAQDLRAHSLSADDLVVGLAASGRTPYVIGGLRYASSIGARTVAIACNRNSEIGAAADLAIEPETGPEVLSGSTRLKAGTAQKLILNMISTGAMTGIGKVYENLMVDVKQSNEKLVTRAQNIVMEACSCSRDVAEQTLAEADGSVKLAITMLLLDCSAEAASDALEKSHGHIRQALEMHAAPEDASISC